MSGRKILLLEDGSYGEDLASCLESSGWQVKLVAGSAARIAKSASSLLERQAYDIVIADICWQAEAADRIDVSGRTWASEMRQDFPQDMILLISAYFPELWSEHYALAGIRDEFILVLDKIEMSLREPAPRSQLSWKVYLDRLIDDRCKVRINRALSIEFEGRRTARQRDIVEALDGLLVVASDDKPRRLSVSQGGHTSNLRTYGDAFTSLLQKLFFDFDTLRMRLPSGGEGTPRGRSGTNVALCVARGAEIVRDNLVLKFGQPQRIAREYANYNDYVVNHLKGDRHAEVDQTPSLLSQIGQAYPRYRRSGPLAGVVYRLIGGEGEEGTEQGKVKTQTLEQWIKLPQAEQRLPQVVREVIRLGKRGWYTAKRKLPYSGLVHYYNHTSGLNASRLQVMKDRFHKALAVYDGKTHFQLDELPDVLLRNPINSFRERWAGEPATSDDGTRDQPTYPEARLLRLHDPYYCLVHGDLNLGNVLVDDLERAWFIDFYRTGPGHLFQDFTELESCLVVQAFSAVRLPEFYYSMCAILGQPDLVVRHVEPSAFSTSGYQLMLTVAAIRDEARSVAGEGHLDEYLVSLFYAGLTLLKFYDLGDERLMRALILSSLVCSRLEQDHL